MTAGTVIKAHGLLEPEERLLQGSNQGGTAVNLSSLKPKASGAFCFMTVTEAIINKRRIKK